MHAELLEDIGDLKTFRDAAPRIVMRLQGRDVLPFKQHLTSGRRQGTTQDIEKCALASTIRANDGRQLVCCKADGDI